MVFDVAGTALAIHFEGIIGHNCLVYSPAESCTWCGKNNGVVRGESWPLMSQADRFWSVDAHSPLHPGTDPRLGPGGGCCRTYDGRLHHALCLYTGFETLIPAASLTCCCPEDGDLNHG